MPRKSKEERAAYQKEYYQKNKEKAKADSKKRREAHRDEALAYAKQYYQDNKEQMKAESKQYRQTHKEQRRQSQKLARKNDPMRKIHHNVSNLIRITIQRNGASKNGNSIIDNIGYSIEDLKVHLESQFEFWMNWDNWGIYDVKTWDEHNSSTWTWQLDHIIPQSDLIYTSMEDENFKKCWALTNLRPLSAKLNSIDGATRKRHKITT